MTQIETGLRCFYFVGLLQLQKIVLGGERDGDGASLLLHPARGKYDESR